MSWFRKREPKPVDPAPITGWSIVTQHGDSQVRLDGMLYDGDDAEVLRYVDALADGLRRAGYDPEVTLTRETVVSR